MARTWKAVLGMTAWLGLMLPLCAQAPGAGAPPPPVPIGISGGAMMVPVWPVAGQPMPPWHGPPPGAPNGLAAQGMGGGVGPGIAPGAFHAPEAPCEEPGAPDIESKYIRENAFGEENNHWIPYRHQLNLEYLILYFKSFNLPPVATTGSILDPIPGAIGQPGTLLLHGGDDGDSAGPTNAFRITWTSWLMDPELVGFDASFMIMEQRTRGVAFKGEDFGDVLSRPYFDPIIRAANADPRAVTATKVGTMRDIQQTRMMGAEGNFKYNLTGMASMPGPVITLFGGPRWLKLDEKFIMDDDTSDIPFGSGQSFLDIRDNFTCYNELFGGQLGLAVRHRWDRLFLDFSTKLGILQNFQTGRILGLTRVRDDTTGDILTAFQGLYAQPTNIGNYRQEQISLMPEFGVNVGFFIFDNFKFSVGYGGFFLTNVLRPDDLIDPIVNIQPLNVITPIPPLRPAPTQLGASDFWSHWINFSFEFVF
jgi:hypothetical protein